MTDGRPMAPRQRVPEGWAAPLQPIVLDELLRASGYLEEAGTELEQAAEYAVARALEDSVLRRVAYEEAVKVLGPRVASKWRAAVREQVEKEMAARMAARESEEEA